MKAYFLAATAFIAAAIAQSINIASPAVGQTFPSNQNVTVQVQLPDSLSPSLQMPQLVIGVLSCKTSDCSDVGNNTLTNTGGVTESVPFTPQRADPTQSPFQNYSVSLGDTTGTKLIRILHVFGVGAGLQATMEFKSVIVTSF
ncbi:hypothetical protein K439DRAFT_1628353 [Ramaria rubella]|nr:hypothetical protein K439DRAFT_1628353 [Ramaria rubella]